MMKISLLLDLMTRLVHGMRPLWLEAGNLETALLSRSLRGIAIDRPIFITGLARAGSTLLLEFLAAHRSVATHQYRDFPFIFTPYFSRKFTALFTHATIKRERAHGDRMLISPHSPEGMEEMLWMAFAKQQEHFSAFYRAHIKKLLLASGSARYAAKNNNLMMRLPELLKLFPDARVIVPVRDPVAHIGSLMRQHARFMQHANHPRAILHLATQGHFEFGPTRTWRADDEITGWAGEWNNHYRPLIPYLGQENILIVPFEKLCDTPHDWLAKIESHAQLQPQPELIAQFSTNIHMPDYYDTAITEGDAERIRILTNDINRTFMKSVL